jgi:hypothetical protein
MSWKWLERVRRWLEQLFGRSGSGPQEVTMSEQYDPQELLGCVRAALVELEWRFGEDAEHLTFNLGYGGKNGIYYCLLHVHAQFRAVLFHAHVQCRVPEEKRAAVAEFITRANYGMWIGNFELDLRDGEVRYKSSLDLVDGELTPGMLNALMRTNLNTLDRYLPGLMSVLWNDVAPQDAVGMIEAA